MAKVEVKMLRQSPEIKINRLSKKAYPNGWVGMLDEELADEWCEKEICIKTADIGKARNPAPVDDDDDDADAGKGGKGAKGGKGDKPAETGKAE